MASFYYVYVLYSLTDQQLYTGYTKDLKSRIDQHKNGRVKSTKNRRPLKLIYFEGSRNQKDATHREKYLKTSHGKMFLGNRLKNWRKHDKPNLI